MERPSLIIAVAALLCLAVVGGGGAEAGDEYELARAAVVAGAQASGGGGYEEMGIVHPDSGAMVGGGYEFVGGVLLPSRAGVVSPHACVGDCDRSHEVAVGEILVMVDVALGTVSVGKCGLGDASRDGRITVDEVVEAVKHVGAMCPTS